MDYIIIQSILNEKKKKKKTPHDATTKGESKRKDEKCINCIIHLMRYSVYAWMFLG